MSASRLPVLAAAIALVALAAFVLFVLVPGTRERKEFGFSLQEESGRQTIGAVPSGPASGLLQVGDVVIAWNGDERIQQHGAASYFYRQPPHQPYTLTVLRNGAPKDVTLQPASAPNPQQPLRAIMLAVVATTWAAFGVVVMALRPRDRASRLCAGMMIFMAASQFGISIADIDHPVGGVQTALRFAGFAAYPWHIVFGFLMMCALAPMRSSMSSPIVQGVVVAAAMVYSASTAPGLLTLLDASAAATVADVSRGWQGIIGRVVLVAALAGTIVVPALSYRRAETVTQRRRMAWLLAGIFPGSTAYIISAALSVAARARPELAPWYDRALLITLFISVTVPMAFAYALARHELFGVRLVIRRSIQYALARSALLWMLLIPGLGLAWTVWRNPDVTVRGLVSAGTPHFYLLLAIAASLLVRERLLTAIDRRFFRDHRDRERILVELASDIGRSHTPEEAVALAEHALNASLHPSSVSVWLRGEGTPMPEGFFDSDTVSLDEIESGVDAPRVPGTPPPKAAALTVAIIDHDGQLIGALQLGTKRSEEPYSAKDRSLLRAVARQIAMVVENATLRREVGHERRIRHEVLGRLDESAIDVLRECPRCGACFDRGVELCPTDGAELMPTLPVARTIAGKYRLERLIGRGGMGSVYEATDLGIGRLVAVKVLRAHAFGNETSTRRFRREARILGAISQRNIVTVHDYGTLASGSAFLVMERLHGATWRTVLRERGGIAPRELAAWVEQLCDALIAAHANGVVHRDLKPENVIIVRRPEGSLLKVLDFGLAKQFDADGETEGLSLAGAVMGTPGYMSPEQLAGRSVDHRADVFAVAVMVWEALSGRKPFDGSTPADLALAMHLAPPAVPDEIPPAVGQVLRRALAHDPARRVATVTDLRRDLLAALATKA